MMLFLDSYTFTLVSTSFYKASWLILPKWERDLTKEIFQSNYGNVKTDLRCWYIPIKSNLQTTVFVWATALRTTPLSVDILCPKYSYYPRETGLCCSQTPSLPKWRVREPLMTKTNSLSSLSLQTSSPLVQWQTLSLDSSLSKLRKLDCFLRFQKKGKEASTGLKIWDLLALGLNIGCFCLVVQYLLSQQDQLTSSDSKKQERNSLVVGLLKLSSKLAKMDKVVGGIIRWFKHTWCLSLVNSISYYLGRAMSMTNARAVWDVRQQGSCIDNPSLRKERKLKIVRLKTLRQFFKEKRASNIETKPLSQLNSIKRVPKCPRIYKRLHSFNSTIKRIHSIPRSQLLPCSSECGCQDSFGQKVLDIPCPIWQEPQNSRKQEHPQHQQESCTLQAKQLESDGNQSTYTCKKVKRSERKISLQYSYPTTANLTPIHNPPGTQSDEGQSCYKLSIPHKQDTPDQLSKGCTEPKRRSAWTSHSAQTSPIRGYNNLEVIQEVDNPEIGVQNTQ